MDSGISEMRVEPHLRKLSGPDGLQSWGVVLAICLINCVMAGLGRMSGILYVAFIDIFDVDRLHASLPFSARSVTRNLLGPVVGILGQKYGVRAVTITGGILGTISAASCFFAKDILWMSILWGGLNGAGTAMAVSLPQIMIGQYFKKYRSTAFGIAFSGDCIGSFIFPVILEFLLYTYGLSGTFVILSGIIIHVIPLAMFLKKPTWINKKENDEVFLNVIAEEKISNVKIGKGTLTSPVNDSKLTTTNEEVPNFHVGINNYGVEMRRIKSDHNFSHNTSSLQNYGNHSMHNIGVNIRKDSHAYFAGDILDERTINTNILRKNKDYIAQLLTRYFVNQTDQSGNVKVDHFYRSQVLNEEIENLCIQVERVLCEKTLQVDMLMDKFSKKYFSFNNKCIQNKQDTNTDSKKRKIVYKPSKENETSENPLILIFKHLVDTDRTILQVFPSEEHDIICKILEQFRLMHILLEHDSSMELLSDSTRDNKSTINRQKRVKVGNYSNTFGTHIKTAFRLHSNPYFMLISLSRAVHFLTFITAVTIIVDYSIDKGFLKEEGKYVIAALSVGDFLGRLCFGWITDKEFITLPRYIMFVMILQGVVAFSLSMTYSKVAFLSSVAFLGLMDGSLFVRHPVLVARYMKNHEQSVAMGCFSFFSGVIGLSLPSYIGYFRDTAESYDYIFCINGGIGALVGFLWALEPFFNKCCKSEKEYVHISTT